MHMASDYFYNPLQAMQDIIYLLVINTIESMEPPLFIFAYLLLLLYLTLHIVFEAVPSS